MALSRAVLVCTRTAPVLILAASTAFAQIANPYGFFPADWIKLKSALLAVNGESYFESHVKDAVVPLQGFVISHVIDAKEQTVVLGLEDKAVPEMTLHIEYGYRGRMPQEPIPAGSSLGFECIMRSYVREPFAVEASATEIYTVGGQPFKGPRSTKPRQIKKKAG